MIRKSLIIFGAVLNIAWGAAHLFPTGSVVSGFGAISNDNRNIITMEWINEGLTLIFMGAVVLLVTVLTRENNRTQKIIYLCTALMLFSMAIVSLFTGFNIDFLPFRLCPLIFSISGMLILQGSLRK